MDGKYKRRLHRLPDRFYRGTAAIHWVHCIKDRKTGWLNETHHSSVREALLHAMSRSCLCCPAYTLMPDHLHILWLGCDEHSDQISAMRMFRKQWKGLLGNYEPMIQPYDHLLRPDERNKRGFARVAEYIWMNPVRKDLLQNWEDWPYSGALFPGYPSLDPRKYHFWENFWNAYADCMAGKSSW